MRLPPLRALALALALSVSAVPFAYAQEDPQPATDELTEAEAAEAATPRDPQEIYADLDLFGEVFDRIRAEYVDAPDEQELIRAAIQGMLTSLDPHSGYLSPESYSDVQEDTSGQFGGLGIEVTMEEGVIKVVSPIDDTPAAKAGIRPNDFIVALDGQQIQGLALDDAVAKMRGKVGTKIVVTVAREGETDTIDFELTRDIIAMRAVRMSMEGDVAVLRLSKFSEQAYSGIQKAVEDIYKERNGVAPKGIILDLRNNPGGLVDS